MLKVKIFLLISIIIILISCNYTSQKDLTDVEQMVSEIDSLYVNGKFVKKFYPNRSYCGGALNGYYHKNELVLIDALLQGAMSYTKRKMYFKNSEFIKIVYQEHEPELIKYWEKYPKDKYEFDLTKLTFSDTIYEVTFGKKLHFKKSCEDKVLTTKINSALIQNLVDCGNRMKKELESIEE